MLSDTMSHFGLTREFDQAGYFETEHHQPLIKEITTAIKKGRIISVSGIVGCGKTMLLLQLQNQLQRDKEVVVARSLAVDKGRVTLNTLMLALYYDLSTDEKAVTLPKQPEVREHRLVELLHKQGKPAVLFIDDAHELHGLTLRGLKRLMETARDNGETLSLILAGHPKLHRDLSRSNMEEIGARTSKFRFEGLKGQQRDYIEWLLSRCRPSKAKPETIITDEAIDRLADSLATPLQINYYLTLALEEAYQIGQKSLTVENIGNVLAKDLDDPEPRLIRHGYDTKSLAQLASAKPAEIRSLLRGQLPLGRAQELKEQLLSDGVPI
jgi:type II secretory pathway predicted ATPase ExeA